MIFYKCDTCGLMTSEIFRRCPSCGVESSKTKQEFESYYNKNLSNDNQLIKENE